MAVDYEEQVHAQRAAFSLLCSGFQFPRESPIGARPGQSRLIARSPFDIHLTIGHLEVYFPRLQIFLRELSTHLIDNPQELERLRLPRLDRGELAICYSIRYPGVDNVILS